MNDLKLRNEKEKKLYLQNRLYFAEDLPKTTTLQFHRRNKTELPHCGEKNPYWKGKWMKRDVTVRKVWSGMSSVSWTWPSLTILPLSIFFSQIVIENGKLWWLLCNSLSIIVVWKYEKYFMRRVIRNFAQRFPFYSFSCLFFPCFHFSDYSDKCDSDE